MQLVERAGRYGIAEEVINQPNLRLEDHQILSWIDELPAETRAQLYARALELYPHATKSLADVYPAHWPQRQSLNLLLRHLRRPEEEIVQATARGVAPVTALDEYLRDVSSRLPYTTYGAARVMQVGHEFQRVLRRWVGRRGSRVPTEILVGGSFMMGKANAEASDVDIIDPKDRIPPALLKELSQAARQFLPEGAKPTGNLDATAIAKMSPLFLRIHTTRMYLVTRDVAGQTKSYRLRNPPRPRARSPRVARAQPSQVR